MLIDLVEDWQPLRKKFCSTDHIALIFKKKKKKIRNINNIIWSMFIFLKFIKIMKFAKFSRVREFIREIYIRVFFCIYVGGEENYPA